jgi:hypothetical protein
MFDRNPVRGRPDLFLSAKTSTAIPARCGLLREALVQASLDAKVRSIEYLASAVVASEPIDLDAIVLRRDDGRFLLDVVPARRVRGPKDDRSAASAVAELGLTHLTVTAEDIAREPRCGNARLVWSYNGIRVPVELRLAIVKTLMDEGPMHLGRLLETVRSEHDPAPALMALACADTVELDLESLPLGPMTTVRPRT